MVSPMKRSIPLLLAAVVVVLLAACQPMRFTQYTGPQPNWPLGNSFSAQVFDVPVYYALPEKSYSVLGYVQFEGSGTEWNQGDLKLAARMAKDQGGNALLMLMGGQPDTPSLRSFRESLGLGTEETAAVVLQWK